MVPRTVPPTCSCQRDVGRQIDVPDWFRSAINKILAEIETLKAAVGCKDIDTTQHDRISRMQFEYENFLRTEQDMLRRYPIDKSKKKPAKITEIDGDLFADAPPGAALAQCIGADVKMGAGLAVIFREMFGHINYLISQQRQPGQVATLPIYKPNGELDRYIFNLVTKPKSANCLPREEEIILAVQELAHLCTILGVKTLAMPKIGAGLDRQPWHWVRKVIEQAFAGVDTEILIFLHPTEYPNNECRKPTYSEKVASYKQTPVTIDKGASEKVPSNEAITLSTAPVDCGAPIHDATLSGSAASKEVTGTNESVTPSEVTAPDEVAAPKESVTPEVTTPSTKTKNTPKISKEQRQAADLEKAESGTKKKKKSSNTSRKNSPGRGGAQKSAKATVSAAGGPAGRSSGACGTAGALSSSAPGPTLPPSGEPVLFSTPLKNLQSEIEKPSASPDVFHGYSIVAEILYDRARVENEKDDENVFSTPGNKLPPNTTQSVAQEALRGKESDKNNLPTTQAEIDPAEDSTLVRNDTIKNLPPPKLKPNS